MALPLSNQSATLLMPTKLPLKPGYKSKPVVNPQKLAVHPRARSRNNFERWHGWFDAAIIKFTKDMKSHDDDQGMGNCLGGSICLTKTSGRNLVTPAYSGKIDQGSGVMPI